MAIFTRGYYEYNSIRVFSIFLLLRLLLENVTEVAKEKLHN